MPNALTAASQMVLEGSLHRLLYRRCADN